MSHMQYYTKIMYYCACVNGHLEGVVSVLQGGVADIREGARLCISVGLQRAPSGCRLMQARQVQSDVLKQSLGGGGEGVGGERGGA